MKRISRSAIAVCGAMDFYALVEAIESTVDAFTRRAQSRRDGQRAR